MSRRVNDLNESQKKAVMTTEGPVLVVAGPGTGKTLTIVRRIAHLIRQGVRPENILAVTFTNRAAREMKERAEALLGAEASKLFIGTFHLLGLRIIRDGREADFAIYGRDKQLELLKPLMDGSARKSKQAAERISRIKNCLEDADSGTEEIYRAYQGALREHDALDFDDLIRVPIEALEGNAQTRNGYRDRFKYIIVDEYQDINPAQYRLLRLLAGANHAVCAVGDPDQAIYAFRGADPGNVLNFEKDFPGAVRITLIENYRSTHMILNAADSVIGNNRKRIGKDLVPTLDKGPHVSVISAPDERTESALIIQEIEERMGGTSHYQLMQGGRGKGGPERSFRFSDFGVLFRTNAQAKALEEAFAASGIPYQMVGRRGSAQAGDIEKTIAYLRSFIRPDDAAEPGPGDAQEAALLTAEDFFDPRADAVTLMTLHMAKGLEFPVVFMAGCEDGLTPCTLMKDGADIEEERRLFYVGMTRAKDELLLLHARSRFLYGRRLTPSPSPFLLEIPEAFRQNRVVPDRVKKQKEPDPQMGLF